MAISLTQCLHRALQQQPERITTVFGARRQTYLQLHDRVTKLAGGLRDLGIC